ncbi:hypothetical protein FRB94_009804 [Tulasnella sp. JGI-2019a]|nr:hypothetical protein FRB94_009804 [Tulasnella sp. JGI-2019a]
MAVSSDLCMCHEVYPIIIYHIPTSFDPTSQADTDKLIDDNANVLGSFKCMCWANAKKAQAEAASPLMGPFDPPRKPAAHSSNAITANNLTTLWLNAHDQANVAAVPQKDTPQGTANVLTRIHAPTTRPAPM